MYQQVQVSLTSLSEPEMGKTIILQKQCVSIGRHPTNNSIHVITPLEVPSSVTKTQRTLQLATLPTPSIKVHTSTATITLQKRRTHQLFASMSQTISIGRDPSNAIVIDKPVVSGIHAQLSYENNKWVIIHPHPRQPNMQTTNGLLL